MVKYATKFGVEDPYSIPNKGPTPRIDKEEGLPLGALDIAWVDASRKNLYHWSRGLKWYERLHAHATLNSARKNYKCKRPFAPKDSLDFILDSVYCPELETFSEKTDPYLQKETVLGDDVNHESWRLLKNRIVIYPDKSVPRGHPLIESNGGVERRENIYNVKLGIAADHSPQTNPGYSRTPSGAFYCLFQTDGQKLLGTKCDYQFVSSNYSLFHGRFYSPRYPSNYPKNVKCSYKFRARQKERIRIVFEEVALQKGDLSCLNRADLIKIYNGRNAQAPVIRSLCNEISEVEILSTGPDMYIEFVANSDWPGQGFKANYQFQTLDIPNGHSYDMEGFDSLTSKSQNDNGPSVSATTSGCDVMFSSDVSKSGTFVSPQYPNPYPPRSHCRYDFQGRGRERVQIVFTDFNLYQSTKDSKECDSLDSVNVYVHIDGRLEKIDTFCGSTIPKSVMSNGPRLMLEFRGIYSSRKVRGFRASYSFVENFGIGGGQQLTEYPCAFVFSSNESRNGTFVSPNFPGFYPRDTECHFFFHGNQREKVNLHFTYFDIEGVLPCEAISASDYIEFSNYMARDRKYSRYCGQLKPFSVQSDRKFFRVTFRSNDRLDGTGFQAFYQFLGEVESSQPKPVLRSSAEMSLNFYFSISWVIVFFVIRNNFFEFC